MTKKAKTRTARLSLKMFEKSAQNSLRVFTLMAGPGIPSNLTVGDENNPIGLVTDSMMTVADILGVKPEVQAAGLINPGTASLLDQL